MDKKRLTQNRELCKTVSAFGKIQVPGISISELLPGGRSHLHSMKVVFFVFSSFALFGRGCMGDLRVCWLLVAGNVNPVRFPPFFIDIKKAEYFKPFLPGGAV